MIDSSTDQLLIDLTEKVNGRYYGKYRGVVSDNDDPKHIGRLRVKVPKLFQEVETQWAMPCSPYTGNGEGFFMVPPVKAGVWIEFEEGNINCPIWSGGWWCDEKAPTNENGSESAIKRKIIRSGSGLVVALDDDSNKISISDDGAKNFITLEVKDGKVKIQATAKVVVEAPQIELVNKATHPLVFGDNLLTFLNQMINIYQTHTHPGELALGVFPVTPIIPFPPMPLATPSLLSTKVKTG